MYDGRFEFVFFEEEPESFDISFLKGAKYAWKDFGLIPTSRPSIAMPTPKTNKIEIPGANAIFDLSDDLWGYPLYGNRSGTLEFVCETSNDVNSPDYWIKRKNALINYIHGRKLKMLIYPEIQTSMYYYEGRFEVDEWKNEASRSTVIISYDLYPYKKYMVATLLRASVNDQRGTMVLEAGEEPVTPSFIADLSPDSNYVVVQTENVNPFKAWTYAYKTILKIDGTTENAPKSDYDLRQVTYAVARCEVKPGDLIVVSGYVSSRSLSAPYLLIYGKNGEVITYLLPTLFNTAPATDKNYTTRKVPETAFYVPENGTEAAACFEIDGLSIVKYSGNPRYLPKGEKTYFSDIVLTNDTVIYFKTKDDTNSGTVSVEYRKGVLA